MSLSGWLYSVDAMSEALRVPLQLSGRHFVILPPNAILWQSLLSGNRETIASAVDEIHKEGLTDEYAGYLIQARCRGVRRRRHLLGFLTIKTAYTERERRSALSALGLLWGGLGREVAVALDPKGSHFDRERAHRSLRQRRDQRAVQPILGALIDGQAIEDWQCIDTLGALGNLEAADGLLQYLGLDSDTKDRPISLILDFGLEVGRALRSLSADHARDTALGSLTAAHASQRAAAALTLAGWQDEYYADKLLPLVEDSDPHVRLAAVIALGELGAAAALQPLEKRLFDPDSQMRFAVEKALQQVMESKARQALKAGQFHPAILAQRRV
jgi:HEAT repeats